MDVLKGETKQGKKPDNYKRKKKKLMRAKNKENGEYKIHLKKKERKLHI